MFPLRLLFPGCWTAAPLRICPNASSAPSRFHSPSLTCVLSLSFIRLHTPSRCSSNATAKRKPAWTRQMVTCDGTYVMVHHNSEKCTFVVINRYVAFTVGNGIMNASYGYRLHNCFSCSWPLYHGQYHLPGAWRQLHFKIALARIMAAWRCSRQDRPWSRTIEATDIKVQLCS